ncbi:uncharacterized protein Gasu_09700 [Galdieria sulphuraria]|uniref:Uncharacterized protein n=1 Tax=Galdieria sulphuraria TaxID=130081 RepID=M2Y797_GALSU|nr:uncharacterized protein Gasu_09700 [Galdieria sulphuraria]EME31903.1 hypothetical protein Gasu_09700 [Galdieria sulphuraria]|eukprot:XP_005708423.1 hypothetical protein Gasu_09700 [Galdieria sulphuraria]
MSIYQDTSPLDPKVGDIAACVEEERRFASSLRSSPFSLRGILEIGGAQASVLLLKRRRRELTGLEETYNYMKRRSWSRKNAGVVLTVPKHIPFWLSLFFLSYLIFVFISIFLLKNHDENEYLILGLVFLLAFVLSPRVGEMFQWVIAEIYTALYIYYILSRTHNHTLDKKLSSGLTYTGFFCLVICASVVIFTILFYYCWPFLLRGYLTQWTQFAGVVEDTGGGETRVSSTRCSDENIPTGRDSQATYIKTSHSSVAPAYAMHEWLLMQHGDERYHFWIRKFAIHQYQGYLHLLFPWFVKPTISEAHQCYFIGPLKEDLPHGLGAWFDSSPNGENLIGYFDHGIPVGPFESQENVTGAERGNVLINIRMIYMSDVKGIKTLTRAKPQWGVASAECCVSGNISLDGYPVVRDICKSKTCQCLHSKEDSCSCAKEMLLKYYRHLEDTKRLTSILVSVDNDGLKVQGHYPKHESSSLTSIRPQQVTIYLENVEKQSTASHSRGNSSLAAFVENPERRFGSLSSQFLNLSNLIVDKGWEKTVDTEALVFIHGYNHMLVDALKRFGQFLAMAHLPAHLKTFVFNWPAGTSPLSYSLAVGNASSNNVQRDLDLFLQSLHYAGIRKVHFMIHSMGARLFLRAFPLIRKRFQTRRNTSQSISIPTKDMDILPATNQVQQDRCMVCDKVSMTNDDLPPPPPPPFESSTLDQSIQYSGMELSTLIFLNPDYELDAFQTDFPDLYEVCNCITLYADKRDRAVQIAETFCWYQPSLGHQTAPFCDTFEQFCDMDIIDASDLAGNMSFTYHAYWNIHRTMTCE